MTQKLTSSSGLVLMGLIAWALAAFFGATGKGPLAGGFVGAGLVLIIVGTLFRRMYGPTTIGLDKVQTNLTPDVAAIQETRTPPSDPVTGDLDTSTLVARWPTLADALEAIPLDWTKETVVHDDHQKYVHVRTPQAGYELVINAAALDSPAPKWLMVAIAVMGSR